MTESRLLTSKEVAARLGVSEWTLNRMRRGRNAPPWLYVSGRVRYRAGLLEKWIADRTVRQEVSR